MLVGLADQQCFEIGQEVKIKNEDAVGLGTATIEKIDFPTSYSQAEAMFGRANALVTRTVQNLFALTLPAEKERKKLVLATLKIDPEFRVVIPVKRYRQFDKHWISEIDNAEFGQLRAQGAQVIDVRSVVEFAREKIPGSLNVPLTLGPRISPFRPYFSVPLESTNILAIEKVPRQNKATIFVAQNAIDYRALWALLRLKLNDYHTLHWYRGGVDAWYARDGATPKQHAQIRTIATAKEARESMAKGAVFIDVRASRFFSLNSIRGAINIFMQQKHVGYFPVYTSSFLHAERIREIDGQFNLALLPTDKTKEVVFFSVDEYDWAPLKAALLAKASGWTRAAWYRGGFSDWALQSIEHENEYPIHFSIVSRYQD